MATVEELAEAVGMTVEESDPGQMEMDFTAEHEVGETGLALMEDDDETKGDASDDQAEEGTVQ